eukprot:365920-Chlamydomonas_euryale.AAC.18
MALQKSTAGCGTSVRVSRQAVASLRPAAPRHAAFQHAAKAENSARVVRAAAAMVRSAARCAVAVSFRPLQPPSQTPSTLFIVDELLSMSTYSQLSRSCS